MTAAPPIKDKLERPVQRRYAVMRALAEGKTASSVANRYDCTIDAVRQFKRRHRERIDAMAADLNQKHAGQWIADKVQRLETHQKLAEDLQAQIDALVEGQVVIGGDAGELDEDGEREFGMVQDISGPLARLARQLNATLKSAAEELGQLPTRMVVKSEGGGAVHVYGAGVDTEQV